MMSINEFSKILYIIIKLLLQQSLDVVTLGIINVGASIRSFSHLIGTLYTQGKRTVDYTFLV